MNFDNIYSVLPGEGGLDEEQEASPTELHYIGLLELLVGEEFALAVHERGLVRQLPNSRGAPASTGVGLRPRLEIGRDTAI